MKKRECSYKKPYRKILDRGGSIPAEDARKILCKLMSTHVWVDSQNLIFGEGVFEHNKDNAYAILIDPEWEEFRNIILEKASDPFLFSADDIEADEKN